MSRVEALTGVPRVPRLVLYTDVQGNQGDSSFEVLDPEGLRSLVRQACHRAALAEGQSLIRV